MLRRTTSDRETRELAAAVGRRCRGGEILSLLGPLGAGKTTFAKGVAEGLGIDPREVTSPTFLLIHELAGRLPFRHIDAYRVSGAEELYELGVEEMLRGGGVVLVEWPERVPGLLPEDVLRVRITPVSDDERDIELTATGPGHRHLFTRPEHPAEETA